MTVEVRNSASRWTKIAANGVVLISSLCVAAGLAEVGVRIAAPQQLISLRPDLWQPADTVGWVRRPNVSAEINTGERTVHLITDRDGFRIGQNGRSSGIPVLLLGDSFMEALQVEYEQSFAGLIERSLSTAGGKAIAVRNAGVGGWAPAQYLSHARALFEREKYRLVITALYVGNDAVPLRTDYTAPRRTAERQQFRLPKELSKADFVNATLRPLNDALEIRSHLFVMVRKELETFRMKAGMSPQYFPPEFLKSEATANRWAIAADICTEISELARQHGAQALFVLVPADFQVEPDNFYQHVRAFGIDTATVDLDQPSRRLAEELGKRGLTVVDVLARFRARRQAGEHLYGQVDKHLSPAGHNALAELVTPVAAELLAK
jgi:NAD(P)-dependent dehydrogenase (short-subunit alcohol dehydrogenase family)